MHESANKRIKIVRKILKLSQLEFANTLGLTQAAYSYIESGTNNISNKVFLLLKKIHNVNTSWIEHGKGEMFIPNKPETKNTFEELEEKNKTIELLNADIKRLNSERELYIKLLDSKDALIETLKQQIEKA